MKISPKMIAACKAKEACSAGLNWISAKPRTVEQLYKHNRDWFFWLRNILSKPANDAYDAVEKPARAAYAAAVKPANDAYDAVEKPARAAYYAAVKPADDAYYAAAKPALIAALRKDGYR